MKRKKGLLEDVWTKRPMIEIYDGTVSLEPVREMDASQAFVEVISLSLIECK